MMPRSMSIYVVSLPAIGRCMHSETTLYVRPAYRNRSIVHCSAAPAKPSEGSAIPALEVGIPDRKGLPDWA